MATLYTVKFMSAICISPSPPPNDGLLGNSGSSYYLLGHYKKIFTCMEFDGGKATDTFSYKLWNLTRMEQIIRGILKHINTFENQLYLIKIVMDFKMIISNYLH